MTWLYIPAEMLPDPSCEASASSLASADLNWESRWPWAADTSLSVMLNTKPLTPRFWSRECKKAGWTTRLSGLTQPPSTAARGAAKWISSLEDRPARRPRSQGGAKARRTQDGCGLTLYASSTKSGQLSLFSRTCQGCCPSGCERCKQDFDRWTTTFRQESSARQRLARCMCENESSSWPTPPRDYRVNFPTPTSSTHWKLKDYKRNDEVVTDRLTLIGMAKKNQWPTPTTKGNHNRKGSSHASGDGLATAVQKSRASFWPTPTVGSGGQNVPITARWEGMSTAYTQSGRKTTVGLQSAVKKWPTPLAHDAQPGYARRMNRFGTKHGGKNLNDAVAKWPTPTSSDAMKGGLNQKYSSGGQALAGTVLTHDRQQGVASETKVYLSADWTELLMGLPKHWTRIRGEKDGKTEPRASVARSHTAPPGCERSAMP